MNKRVKIIGKEHGKLVRVYIDGVEQKGLAKVTVELIANDYNGVTLVYKAIDVDIEIEAVEIVKHEGTKKNSRDDKPHT